MRIHGLPFRVLSIAGYSDSGKTSAVEQIVSEASETGIAVGYLKGGHHPPSGGSDTDTARITAAGAIESRYCQTDPDAPNEERLEQEFAQLQLFSHAIELLLVEGWKQSPIDKLWVDTRPPPVEIQYSVLWAADSTEQSSSEVVASVFWNWFAGERTMCAGVLMGGTSRRMGLQKELLDVGGRTMLAHISEMVQSTQFTGVALGPKVPLNGHEMHGLQRISDRAKSEGPLGGILGGFDKEPEAVWLILPCDHPLLSTDAVDWLWKQADPTATATIPMLENRLVPTLAVYRPRSLRWLEDAAAAQEFSLLKILKSMPHMQVAHVPKDLHDAFRSANTPAEWEALTGSPPRLFGAFED